MTRSCVNCSQLLALMLVGMVSPVMGCTGGVAGTGSGGSGIGASAGSSGGTSAGAGATSGANSTTTSSGSSTSGGSSTGGAFVVGDGGYVVCSGRPNGDGAPAAWLCQPGTYFCDLTGSQGDCFQCRSDADCLDDAVPTYDPSRPRCDLDSGILGYQGFCQQCLQSSDCAANPAGPFCDLDPEYPFDGLPSSPASSLEPPTETLGFEACAERPADCRLDGGPDCNALNETCDAANGFCEPRSSNCAGDQDCAGLLVPPVSSELGSYYLLHPFCVDGTCSACPGGICQNEICTSSAQCGGFWPTCEGLDGGAAGACGCDSDAQCGDGGLACLPGTALANGGAATSFCGVPCTSQSFPSCQAYVGLAVCDSSTGLCSACSSDQQCSTSFGSQGPDCGVDVGGPGLCGCGVDSDCPAGESCLASAPRGSSSSDPFGICTPTPSRCTPGSCGGYFCDWDSGSCVNNANQSYATTCLSDYDCGLVPPLKGEVDMPFCASFGCVLCRDNADCIRSGFADAGFSKCCFEGDPACGGSSNNLCAETCDSDQDCLGNGLGSHCITIGNRPACGCASDTDCAGNSAGPHCDMTGDQYQGRCTCAVAADCSPGETCNGRCMAECSRDSDCQAGFFCDPWSTCRPRCDDGGTCQAPDLLCDVNNIAGENGLNGSAPGDIWCYACLSGADCPEGLGCPNIVGGHVCEVCTSSADCAPGTTCLADGVCHASCDAGSCARGLVCDRFNLAGNGADLCYQCVTAADCPGGEGCDQLSHTCGTCKGPTAAGGPFDCPPDAICSNYWEGTSGVCLQNCDRSACPVAQPICATLPFVTPDHRYCVGCQEDADCAGADAGAWCDLSIHRTFACQPPPI